MDHYYQVGNHLVSRKFIHIYITFKSREFQRIHLPCIQLSVHQCTLICILGKSLNFKEQATFIKASIALMWMSKGSEQRRANTKVTLLEILSMKIQ